MSTLPNPAAALRKKGPLDGFKEFIARGNVVDLAVGIVIGAAFAAVVEAFVNGILNPLIGGIFGQPNLDNIWTITLRDNAQIKPGFVVTALISFVIIAAAIYFFVVVPLNKLAERRARGEEPAPAAPAEDVQLLTEIRDLLRAQSGSG